MAYQDQEIWTGHEEDVAATEGPHDGAQTEERTLPDEHLLEPERDYLGELFGPGVIRKDSM